jgi:hypothetical protein
VNEKEEGERTVSVVTIPVDVGEDRRLVIEVPPDVPVGPADVVIVPRTGKRTTTNPAREAARAKLRAAGLLSTNIYAPKDAVVLTDEELLRVGRLAPGARPSEELIDEDRGTY